MFVSEWTGDAARCQVLAKVEVVQLHQYLSDRSTLTTLLEHVPDNNTSSGSPIHCIVHAGVVVRV